MGELRAQMSVKRVYGALISCPILVVGSQAECRLQSESGVRLLGTDRLA